MKVFRKCYIGLIFAFLYLPIAILIIFSFNESKSRTNYTGFTFDWYVKLFQNDTILSALWNTLAIAVLSALIATIIGTVAAMGIHAMKKRPRAAVMSLTYLPVLNPEIVTGISLMMFFIAIKLPLGFISLLIAHITFNIPYVILSVLPKLRQLNKHAYEAALDLGAKPAVALRKVILPELMPGIVTGMLLAFTMSIDDFVISFFTTGNGVSNLSIEIYNMTRRGIKPEINALCTVMFVSVLILLLIVNHRSSKNGGEGLSIY